MFWSKTFRVKDTVVVAICDEDLLEKKIGRDHKVKIEKRFYGEKLINENDAIESMKRANIGNLVGKRIIKLSIEKHFIDKKNIMFIGDIPHAQFLK